MTCHNTPYHIILVIGIVPHIGAARMCAALQPCAAQAEEGCGARAGGAAGRNRARAARLSLTRVGGGVAAATCASCLPTCETSKTSSERATGYTSATKSPQSTCRHVSLAPSLSARPGALHLDDRTAPAAVSHRQRVHLCECLQRAAPQAPLGHLRRAPARAAALGVVRDTRVCISHLSSLSHLRAFARVVRAGRPRRSAPVVVPRPPWPTRPKRWARS